MRAKRVSPGSAASLADLILDALRDAIIDLGVSRMRDTRSGRMRPDPGGRMRPPAVRPKCRTEPPIYASRFEG
jgi:hypothetical protein